MSLNPLIVIEALDAGGSQTQTDWLVRRLKKEGWQPHAFHFPQENRATGQLIYNKFLLAKKGPARHRREASGAGFSQREQALLYIQDFFSRAEDIEALRQAQGKHVIVSDRFYGSTLAYQTIGLTGAKRQAVLAWIAWLTEKGTPALPKPDLVILLDTPVEISLERLRDKKKDFFENKAKLTAIRKSYLQLAKERKWRIVNSVDKQGTPRTREDMHEEVWGIVRRLL